MDLHFLPLVRHDGQDQAELPGLHIAAPPRRPARGRQPDRLVIYLSMEGNAPLPQDQQEQLLKRLAESYFKTPGSVTAAMRTVIESLNQYLLDRNLRGASSGRQGLGLLTLLTLREDRLYLAQCGPVHAYLLAESEVRHINDPQPTRRGLGLGRLTNGRRRKRQDKPAGEAGRLQKSRCFDELCVLQSSDNTLGSCRLRSAAGRLV